MGDRLEGYLRKKGEVNPALKKRFFVLEGTTITYYKKKGDRPISSISIVDADVHVLPSAIDFIIESPYTERVFQFRADSPDICSNWVEILTARIEASRPVVSGPSDLVHNYHASFTEEGLVVRWALGEVDRRLTGREGDSGRVESPS